MVKELILASGEIALIDSEDYDLVAKYKWYMHKGGYAARSIKKNNRTITVFLHRRLVKASSKYVVDHINGDRLDNRKANLRIVTAQQNAFNRCRNVNKKSSVYKGVFWSKEKSLWLSLIKIDGKSIHLGYFNNEIDAACAYNEKAVELFGGYARLNDVDRNTNWAINRVFIRTNITGYRGVTHQKEGKYQARITIAGKRKSLGYFDSAIEAAKKYNQVAIQFLGERALLNKF
ncbi:MAG: HNH endonuclease [Filifactoraceae bacterium]